MSILVRKTDGIWQEWSGDVELQIEVATLTAQYHDGRTEELACDPYPVAQRVNGGSVASLFAQGIWTLEEVQAVGGAIAEPFEVPEGKQITGPATYTEDQTGVHQIYQVEDIPPPPPPSAEEKFARFLDAYGLTKEELQEMLA